jgi:hypothetical protein
MTTSAEGKMMSSPPLESGFNTRNQPVILGNPEVMRKGGMGLHCCFAVGEP